MPTFLFAAALTVARVEPSEPQLIDIDATLLVQLAIFLVVLVLLTVFLFRPYLRLREARESVTEGPQRDAKALEARALALAEEADGKVTAARAEAVAERERARVETARREREIRDRARIETQSQLDAARAKIAADAEAARGGLAAQVEVLSRKMAERVLARPVR